MVWGRGSEGWALTWHGAHDAAQLPRRAVARVRVLHLRSRLLRAEEGLRVHDE